MRGRLWLTIALCSLGAAPALPAAVEVTTGPTPIPGGSARAPGDLTVRNEHLAFALSVESPVPYGVPRGALVDLAPVSGGTIGHDRVVFADFIPNNWSAWPNTYQRVEILERDPERARIRAVRDFGSVRLETTYTLRAGSDRIELSARMSNEGDTPLSHLLSGFTLWPSSGYLFPVPGLAQLNEGAATGALAPRVSAYDAGWSITLHAPYLDHVGSHSRDLFLTHDLAPGQSRSFEAWLQVSDRGDLAPVLAAEIARAGTQPGRVQGSVRDRAGQPLDAPVVVIEKSGVPFAWTLGASGHYALELAAGDYDAYASGPNYSRSPSRHLSVAAGGDYVVDFAGLGAPAELDFHVREAASGRPLDARITITGGAAPVVEYLGRKTFFTELRRIGEARVPIAPGRYRFSVSSGAGVLARDVEVGREVAPGQRASVPVRIRRLFDPPAHGWYAADLHHHADQAEAVTPPEDLARSQLAAGLDVLFVSDHDATVNHPALRRLARERGVPFIAGIEISPSWGHFNAYPLPPGAELAIDTSTASAADVLREARREGATIVQVNHPFIPYGYFASVEAGTAPGGFVPDFDLIEINSNNPADDARVLERAYRYWNARQHYYLSAGSDTHDVWNEQSGRVRMFAHLAGAPSAEAFAAALKAGHAYATYGPLIEPSVMFGASLRPAAGAPFVLDFALGSVRGLREAVLVGDGAVCQRRTFDGALRGRARFGLRGGEAHWYALTVEDTAGRKAYSDPIWVTTADPAAR
ncbi:MAG: CehA/McbA family metallohydrolase [Gammaproteobacteria bacterium]|nr:CehA/McbA family metallohydrolase [Gammaproteobacteria bacterium]